MVALDIAKLLNETQILLAANILGNSRILSPNSHSIFSLQEFTVATWRAVVKLNLIHAICVIIVLSITLIVFLFAPLACYLFCAISIAPIIAHSVSPNMSGLVWGFVSSLFYSVLLGFAFFVAITMVAFSTHESMDASDPDPIQFESIFEAGRFVILIGIIIVSSFAGYVGGRIARY